MPEFNVKGKTVLVTGASSGIGRATAEAFAQAGARVALLGRSSERLRQAADSIRSRGGEARELVFDLSRESQVRDAIGAARDAFGPIDVLINNAAYAAAGLIEDCPLAEVRKNFEVNFFAPLALVQAAIPDMKRRGSGQIINVSSGVGKRALPGFSPYCATKFALNGLTESLRLEVRPFGIDVILVSPGRVVSDFHRRIEFYGRWRTEIPSMSARSPGAIARLILNASRRRLRDAEVWGPGRIGTHLNYWSPRLVDWMLSRKYPVS